MQHYQLILIGLVSSMLLACGNSSNKNSAPSPVTPPGGTPSTLSFPQNPVFHGVRQGTNQPCTTPSVQVADLRQYCEYLRNDVQNNYCAKNEREQAYNQNCLNNPANPNPPAGQSLKDNPNNRNRDLVKRPRRTADQVNVVYTCTSWAWEEKESRALGGFFKFDRSRVIPTAQTFSWDGRRAVSKTIKTSRKSDLWGQISVDMSPARSKDSEPSAKLSVKGFDRNKDISFRAFADQPVYLQIEEKGEDERTKRFLRVECKPSALNLAKKTHFRPIDCRGSVQDTNASTKEEIEAAIAVEDLQNATSLFSSEYNAFQDLVYSAYKGDQSGDESARINFSVDQSYKSLEFGGNLHAPLEVQFENRSQRNPSKLDLKCAPRGT